MYSYDVATGSVRAAGGRTLKRFEKQVEAAGDDFVFIAGLVVDEIVQVALSGMLQKAAPLPDYDYSVESPTSRTVVTDDGVRVMTGTQINFTRALNAGEWVQITYYE